MKYRSSKRANALAISPGVRLIVGERDNWRCIYCWRRGNPEAHYIARSHGGLGIPENILTLCRECHEMYDHGPKEKREGMRELFREYLMSKYPNWDEAKLIYRKDADYGTE